MRDDPYAEGTDWPGLSLPFVIWAAHFAILWGASSLFPGQAAARWIALIATLAMGGMLIVSWRRRDATGRLAALAYGLAAIAIIFGGLPALVG